MQADGIVWKDCGGIFVVGDCLPSFQVCISPSRRRTVEYQTRRASEWEVNGVIAYRVGALFSYFT